jgi:hypothetical protein
MSSPDERAQLVVKILATMPEVYRDDGCVILALTRCVEACELKWGDSGYARGLLDGQRAIASVMDVVLGERR